MNIRTLSCIPIFFLSLSLFSQSTLSSSGLWISDTLPNPKRTKLVTGLSLGTYAVAMTGLGTLWYSQEDLGSFRFFDDSKEWKQMDKLGHAFSNYHTTRLMIDMYQWAGQSQKRSILLGTTIGFGIVSTVEVFDGFGESWGFSFPDLAANAFGAGLAVLNEVAWGEPRLQLKLGFSPSTSRSDTSLYRLFGSTTVEQAFKNYNLQTIWLSARVHSFLPEGKFKDRYPKWLNFAVGYGAEGLAGGYDDPNGAWRTREYRQLYFSLDLDLSQIHTRSGFLNSVFSLLSAVRIPFPVLRFDRNGWGVGGLG